MSRGEQRWMTQERLSGRSGEGRGCWVVRLLMLGRETLAGGAREGELEREGRGRGAVTGEVVGQVVLQYVGVEGLPRHHDIALHDILGL